MTVTALVMCYLPYFQPLAYYSLFAECWGDFCYFLSTAHTVISNLVWHEILCFLQVPNHQVAWDLIWRGIFSLFLVTPALPFCLLWTGLWSQCTSVVFIYCFDQDWSKSVFRFCIICVNNKQKNRQLSSTKSHEKNSTGIIPTLHVQV